MRGQRYKSIVAENMKAGLPEQNNRQYMAMKKKLCWKCQQEKSPVGGSIKTFLGGPMKFICKDCVEAKVKKGPQ